MKCLICGASCGQAFLRLGGYCCDEHREELLRRHRQRLVELRREDVRAMPTELTVADFERYALKLAVHLIAGLGPELLQRYRAEAPGMLDPLEMAQALKADILQHMPATHVALEHASGLQTFFFDGTYSFRQPVPARLVVEAMVKAGLVEDSRQSREGP